jgi:retron-type reverse transcriptase
MAQKSGQLELPFKSRGEAPRVERSEQTEATAGNASPGMGLLLEKALERPNLLRALQRVKQNRGSPGSDGMTVDELPDHLRACWPTRREQLLTGRYQPQPVRQCEIDKPGGGRTTRSAKRAGTSNLTSGVVTERHVNGAEGPRG